jgi:lysozyme
VPLRRRLLLADLSNNNPSPIDFKAMRKAGCYGVLLKVSEGTAFVDRTFKGRADAARMAGLRVGGYHFARPGGDPAAQAAMFAHYLGKVERRDLHPALDLETNDAHLRPLDLWKWARGFEQVVHRLTGVRTLVYTYPAFLSAQGWSRPLGTGAGLWIAAYGPNDGHDHGVPAGSIAPWHRFVAHQFTSVGTIAGVHGHVDLSHASSRRKMLAHGLRGLR